MSTLAFIGCRDMNCTLQGGLLGANGECIYRTDVDEAAWEKLQAAINVTSPAEEYFQNGSPLIRNEARVFSFMHQQLYGLEKKDY